MGHPDTRSIGTMKETDANMYRKTLSKNCIFINQTKLLFILIFFTENVVILVFIEPHYPSLFLY